MFKEQYKGRDDSYAVCGNRDQLEKAIDPRDGKPFAEKYDWWENMKPLAGEPLARTAIRINRVVTIFEDRYEAIELYNTMRKVGLVALRNWLD